ncbi:MAG: hypothetical protein WCG20_04015 [bacterium]
MKKKIIKKKYTLESVSKQLNERIDGLETNLNQRIDNLTDHMNKRFDEQTVEFSNQIRDVLELVDERLKPVEQTGIGI